MWPNQGGWNGGPMGGLMGGPMGGPGGQGDWASYYQASTICCTTILAKGQNILYHIFQKAQVTLQKCTHLATPF